MRGWSQNVTGRRLVFGAALFHVTLSIAIFAVGRTQLAPTFVDRDGIMGSFAFDSYAYQEGAVSLADQLRHGEFFSWARTLQPIHVKFLSIPFALLGPLFGYGPLSAEPFNVLCYAAIVALVFALGREVAGRRLGLCASAMVALWPTFLLHSLQLLKDPLFIACATAVMFCLISWLTRIFSRRNAIILGIIMAVATLLLNVIRFKYPIFIAILFLVGIGFLVLRQLLENRILVWNLVCPLPALAVVVIFLALHPPIRNTHSLEKFKHYPSDGSGTPKASFAQNSQVRGIVTYLPHVPKQTLDSETSDPLNGFGNTLARQVLTIRGTFSTAYPESGSVIDADRDFNDLHGIISYLPRAFEIGCWAPFPNTWLSSGRHVGRLAKLLSAFETIIIYSCEVFALVAIVRSRSNLALWLLFLATISGFGLLGLLVPNMGALYRLRYTFWLWLIIIGMKGFATVASGIRRSLRNESGGLILVPAD